MGLLGSIVGLCIGGSGSNFYDTYPIKAKVYLYLIYVREFLPYLISPERKSICLHTCYQVTYSLFHFLLVSFFSSEVYLKFKFRKEKHSIDNFQNVLSSEGVLRHLEDRGEPRGTKNYAKDCKKGQRILRRKKSF